jgi:soluble lytic murein transglycosylase-like protein
MPDHFLATDDPIDPGTNARRGLAYLKRSFQAAAGDPRLALAGYNGGIAIIHLSEISWADETQRYAYWGDGIYEDAARGASTSPHLLEWLAAGGESLCLEAQRVLGLNP